MCNLKSKTLIEYGFGRLDTLLDEKKSFEKNNTDEKKTFLIATSYRDNNLLERCGVELINILLKSNYKIFLRPHFRIFQESKDLIDVPKKNPKP